MPRRRIHPAPRPSERPRRSRPSSRSPAPISPYTPWRPPPSRRASRRSAGAAPDPAVTALAAALDSLILRDDKANPLGAGDWRAARAAIGAFYADRGFQPIWIDADGLTPAGRSVFARLARASDDGLDLGAYAPPGLVGGPLSVDERAWTEAAISAAVVVYAEQASGSRVSPSHISPLIGVRPDIPDPGAALAEIAAAPDPGARLAEFNPPQKGYRDLREALNRLSGSGVPPARVGVDLGTTPSLLATNADGEALVKIAAPRMKRLHSRFVASARALPAASARERATILANMEMWRWQPRDMGERRIEVNVPDFTVAVMDGDEVVHRARVVVGKPKTPTPIFSNVIRYVVINPSWRVPDSIIRKEMMSKLDYLASHGYEVKTVNGHLTVRQLPGARNALGRLAFMFPNDYAVYLHDTPSRELFNADDRAFSHGCVRVQDPERLAEIVLGWSESRITAAYGNRERSVFLSQPLPIHIEYFTASVDEYGDLRERPDVYGLTQKVAGTLASLRQD